MAKILASDPIQQVCIDVFESRGHKVSLSWKKEDKFKAGIQVDLKPRLKAEELEEIVGQYDGMVVRSGTQVTKEILDKASKLRLRFIHEMI